MSSTIFTIVAGVGLVLLVVSFLFGDSGGDHEVDSVGAGHETDLAGSGDNAYVPSWFNAKVLCAAMVGFGLTGNVVNNYGAPAWLSWPLAFAGALGLATMAVRFVLTPLAKQQYNSLTGRQSFVGKRGRVTMAIPLDGSGQVRFRDNSGATVYERATSVTGTLQNGDRIMVIDITPTSVVVDHDPLASEEN